MSNTKIPKEIEEVADFATILIRRILQHLEDRNLHAIHELIDADEKPDGSFSNTDIMILSVWRGLYVNDPASFWWLGYALSIREGFERILAQFFIHVEQFGAPDIPLPGADSMKETLYPENLEGE